MAFTLQSAKIQNASDTSTSGSPAVQVAKSVVSDTAINILQALKYEEVRNEAFGNPMSYLISPTLTDVVGKMRLRTASVQPVPASMGKVFDCSGRYDQMYTWVEGGSKGYTGQLILPIEVTIDGTPRQVTMYRSANTSGAFGTAPAANLNSTTDIGGDKIDEAGKPVQGLIPALNVRISLVIDSSSSAMDLVSVGDTLHNVQNKWNDGVFLWWTDKQVVCDSAQLAPIRDEYYRVTYSFRWDAWFNCEQVPKYDCWGKHKIDDNGKADEVYWRSLKRSTWNMETIFNGQPNTTIAKDIAKRGTWL